MRRGAGLFLAISMVGCSPPATNQSAEAPADAVPEEPVLEIGGGGCQADWNRQPVTPEVLGERAAAHLQRVVAAAGGPAEIDELPTVRVEVSGPIAWDCARPWLAAIERSGFPAIQLVTGEGNTSPTAGFRIPGMAEPRATVTVAAGGGYAWNGEKVDAAGLQRRAMSSGPFEPPPSADSPSTPPSVVSMSAEVMIAPDAGANVAAIRDAIVTLRETGLEPVISTAGPGLPTTPSR